MSRINNEMFRIHRKEAAIVTYSMLVHTSFQKVQITLAMSRVDNGQIVQSMIAFLVSWTSYYIHTKRKTGGQSGGVLPCTLVVLDTRFYLGYQFRERASCSDVPKVSTDTECILNIVVGYLQYSKSWWNQRLLCVPLPKRRIHNFPSIPTIPSRGWFLRLME